MNGVGHGLHRQQYQLAHSETQKEAETESVGGAVAVALAERCGGHGYLLGGGLEVLRWSQVLSRGCVNDAWTRSLSRDRI